MVTVKDVLEAATFTNEIYDVYYLRRPTDKYYVKVKYNLDYDTLEHSEYWHMHYCGLDCVIDGEHKGIRVKVYVEP